MSEANLIHCDIEAIPIDADDRLCIETFDATGNMLTRWYGPNTEELKRAHDEHKCDWLCGYCYEEACAHLIPQEIVQ